MGMDFMGWGGDGSKLHGDGVGMGMDFMGWGGDGSKLHGDRVGINLMGMGWGWGKFCRDVVEMGADIYYSVTLQSLLACIQSAYFTIIQLCNFMRNKCFKNLPNQKEYLFHWTPCYLATPCNFLQCNKMQTNISIPILHFVTVK